MRTIYIGGRYMLDMGRGEQVVVVAATEDFVIAKPLAGGADMVIARSVFECEAEMDRVWAGKSTIHGTRSFRGEMEAQGFGPTAANDKGWWCIDLTKVPATAYIHGYSA